MIAVVISIVVCLVAFMFVRSHGQIPSWRTITLFNKLPGPKDEPFFFGPIFKMIKMELDDIVPWLHNEFKKYDWYWASWFMGQPGFFIADPDVAEVILTNTKNISKGPDYDVLRKWLRDGLIHSSGEKWRSRRKMLTPSFHFKILDNNLECMNRNWRKVVDQFLETNGTPFEPLRIMGRGALGIICETAMGIELDDDDARCKEYINTVKSTLEEAINRVMNPLLKADFVYNLTPAGRRYNKYVEILHSFTEKVIKEKKAAFAEQKASGATDYSEIEGKKVFLDLLISLAEKENLSDEDIREEVDAFMFGGHDTTSTALQWLLMHLAENPEVQERAYAEQVEIFGNSDRDVTKDDLAKMQYLEQVIKESLRLSPSVPSIARSLVEDIRLPNGLTVPSGTKLSVSMYSLHRNPNYWPDPEVFRPERFSPEESKNRHPYSYIPFSAGPRNCIGQKFAMMEMKIGASTILRSCKITSPMKLADIKVKMLVVLEANVPIKVNITPRN
uniref:Cytochrome P450 4C1 n=1 Tax=Lygus hesperus TaxID=30085 RepID=A0A0A9ZBI9_LYGHE